MSGSWCGNMRASRVKAPQLLLLLLLTALTGTAFCQDDDDAPKEPSVTRDQELESNPTDAVASGEEEDTVDNPETPVMSQHGRLQSEFLTETEPLERVINLAVNSTTSEPVPTTDSEGDVPEGSGSDNVTTTAPDTEDHSDGNPILIIIPVALVVLIICMIVCCIFITCKWNKNKRNTDLSKEDPCLDGSSTEKVPMPMFEEDVPSVLELEMEELDQWMKKDGETAEDSKHM